MKKGTLGTKIGLLILLAVLSTAVIADQLYLKDTMVTANGPASQHIKTYNLGGNTYTLRLRYCDQNYGDCCFEVNQQKPWNCVAINEEFNIDKDFYLEVDNITFDFCSSRPFCNYYTEAYDIADFSIYARTSQGGDIALDPQGDDEYGLEFKNKQGSSYDIPYITNEAGTFKYGDNNDELVFIEGNYSESMTLQAVQQADNVFNIGIQDYFVLSNIQEKNGWDEKTISHILRYISIDTTDRTITVEDMATGTKEFAYDSISPVNGAAIGRTDLIFGGHTYQAFIGNVTENGNDNPLSIDMDADGNIDRAEVRITTENRGILDLGNAAESDGGQYAMGQSSVATWTNTGDVISNSISELGLLTKRGVIARNMPRRNQWVATMIETRPKNEIGINKVLGKGFVLQGTSKLLTPYGVCLDLFSPGNNSAETLTITYKILHDMKGSCLS